MKKYSKAQIIAKNLPTGSYAAGCPEEIRTNVAYYGNSNGHVRSCKYCERTA